MAIGLSNIGYADVRNLAAAATLKTTDGPLIQCDATAAGFAVTLPLKARGACAFFIRKTDSTGNLVTITAGAGETINGAATWVLDSQYEIAFLYRDKDATDWTVVNTLTGSIAAHQHTGSGDGGKLTSPRVITDISDTNGNELFKVTATGSAINEFTVANAAASGTVSLLATGGDTNIPVQFGGKGTGAVKLGQATCAGLDLVGDQPIRDSNANELVKFTVVASAVNEFTIGNAATGSPVTLGATGGDTNIGVNVTPKGDGIVSVSSPLACKTTPGTLTTAGNQTYTAAQFWAGFLARDPNGGAVTDTTPTAAQLVAKFVGARVGDSVLFILKNTADAAETITVSGGAGVTITGTATVAQNNTKIFLVRFDNVTASSEAVTMYSIGTLVH